MNDLFFGDWRYETITFWLSSSMFLGRLKIIQVWI